MKKAKSVPEGFHTVTPYLIVDGADSLIDFIKNAFDGELTYMHRDEDNRVTHATVRIGNSTIMISDTMKEMTPMTAMLYLYVDDVDSMFRQASRTNAQVIQEPRNEFYGDRVAALKDQWGNTWWIGTHVEDVSEDELKKRARARKEEMAH